MAAASKAAVTGGVALLVIAVIVIIVVVVLQLQKQTPSSVPVVQAPEPPAPVPSPGPAPAPEPTPGPTPAPGPQSSLSVAGPAQAPAIQQIGLAAPPPPPSQTQQLLDTLPTILTGVALGLAVEAVLHADVIALKIWTRANMTPALRAELKLARERVASRTITGRMSKAFSRMGMMARTKMGLRWGKTAAQSGETVATTKARSASEAAALSADDGARIMAEEIAEREARRGAMWAVSSVFDAAAIVGLALDMKNVGNYTELVSTSDMRTMKTAIDSEVVNTTIACSTEPLGIACPQTPSPAPAPAPAPGPAPPPREGRYPMFVGPLDSYSLSLIESAISDEFARMFTSQNPPQSIKDLIAAVSSRISSDLGVDTIENDVFQLLWNQYLTPVELENLHGMAFDNVCASEGGVSFLPGNGYDKACSYKTMEACHDAFPWPPPNSDNQDLTYTEWRAKSWFSQWNTITPDNIPSAGACIAADPSIHQMCDEEIGTASGRATNRYIRETGECVNTRDVCRIKGVSYRDSDPPTCYVSEGQNIAELIFGTTLVRFFISGGKLSIHPDPITTVVTVSIPPANSGNSTVDVAVNTVSAGLSSAASTIANGAITAANAIQTGVIDFVNGVVNSTGAAVQAQVGLFQNGTDPIAASQQLLNDYNNDAVFHAGAGYAPYPCGDFLDASTWGRTCCHGNDRKIASGIGTYCYETCPAGKQRGTSSDAFNESYIGNCYKCGSTNSRDLAVYRRACDYSLGYGGPIPPPPPAPPPTCPAGSYQTSDPHTCCPNGTDYAGKTGKCCPTGSTLASDNSTCCPPNTFFTGTSGKCCPTGTTLSADKTQCICPANSIYDNVIHDCRCAQGMTKSDDGKSCVSLSCTGRTQLQL